MSLSSTSSSSANKYATYRKATPAEHKTAVVMLHVIERSGEEMMTEERILGKGKMVEQRMIGFLYMLVVWSLPMNILNSG